MSAAAAALLLGLALGVLLTRGAAWTAAKARVLDLEAAHVEDLERLARLQAWQQEALLRAAGLDRTPSVLQARIDAVVADRRGGARVLPLRPQHQQGPA